MSGAAARTGKYRRIRIKKLQESKSTEGYIFITENMAQRIETENIQVDKEQVIGNIEVVYIKNWSFLFLKLWKVKYLKDRNVM